MSLCKFKITIRTFGRSENTVVLVREATLPFVPIKSMAIQFSENEEDYVELLFVLYELVNDYFLCRCRSSGQISEVEDRVRELKGWGWDEEGK